MRPGAREGGTRRLMTRRADVLSLGAGLGLIATGAVLLLDQDGAIDLSFGLFGAVLALFFAITGIALLWRRPLSPRSRRRPFPKP